MGSTAGSDAEAAAQLEKAGDLEGAARAWAEAAASAPSEAAARLAAFQLAAVLTRLKRFDEALETLEKLAARPGPAVSVLAIELRRAAILVRSRRSAGEPEVPVLANSVEALSCLDLASALDATDALAPALRLYTAAQSSGLLDPDAAAHAAERSAILERRLAARDPGASLPADRITARALHAEIWACLERGAAGDLDEAGRLCSLMPPASEATAPLIAHVLMATAFELEQAGQLPRAQALYRRLMQEPHIDAAHRANAAFRLGLTLAGSGRHQESVAAFQSAVDTPGDAGLQTAAALHLVAALLQRHDYARAAAVADAVLALGSRDAHARRILWFNRLFCRARMLAIPLDDVEAAAELPPPGAEVDPGVASAWLQAAFALEQAGRLRLSRILYERLLTAPVLPAGMRANLHYRTGVVLELMFDYDGAAAQFRAAIETQDSFPIAQAEAHHRLAGLHYMLEDFESALAAYEKLRRMPDLGGYQRAEAQLKYATSLLRLDRLAEAEAELARCREPGAGQGTAIEVQADLLLAEIAERRADWNMVRDCLQRVIRNPAAEPLTKTAALAKLQQTGRRR